MNRPHMFDDHDGGVPPPVTFAEIKGEKPLAKPPLDEEAWTISSLFGILGGGFEAYNPDLLVRNKGADIYNKMLQDPQIKAVYRLTVDILLSRSWRFEKPEDTPQMREIEEFFKYNLTRVLNGAWLNALAQILTSKAHGYSVSEKIYQPGLWNGQTYWFLRSFKGKPYETFRFKHDQYGNLLELIQDQAGKRKILDPRKFVIHVTNSEIDPIYGESDLRAAYRPYWSKTEIEKLWDIYLERMAGGFVVAKANGPLQPNEKTALKDLLGNLSASTGILLPSTIDFDVINPTATDAFEKHTKAKNAEIAKSLLAPNLLGLSEQGRVGSYAQAEVQLESFFLVMTRQGAALADTVNEQIFRELAYWNFGAEDFPRFVFDPFTDEKKRKIAESWAAAVEKNIVINTFQDERRTRDLLGYDQREDGDQPLIAPIDDPTGAGDKKNDTAQPGATMGAKFADVQEITTPWRDRVDFEALLQFYDRAEAEAVQNMADAVDVMYSHVVSGIGMALSIISGDKSQMDSALVGLQESIPPTAKRALNRSIQEFVRAGYDEGRASAQSELEDATRNESFRERIMTASIHAPRHAAREFADGIRLDTAEAYFQAKAFTITGDISEEILKQAKHILLSGIRDEKSLQEIIDELAVVLKDVIGEHDSAGRRVNFGARLETIIRTNISEAFNQALLSVFTDPEIEGFVTALEYSATIDSRTTEFCRLHHGRIYEVNDTIWKVITPPNHYNCRSRLIPVTALDTFAVSEKLSIEPQLGFR